MLHSKATLSLRNELSHNYVGLPVTEMNSTQVGLWILASGLFLGLKSKISHEQNAIYFKFYKRLPNFRLLGYIELVCILFLEFF